MRKFYRIQRSTNYFGPYCFDLEGEYTPEEAGDIYAILKLKNLMDGCNHPVPRADNMLWEKLVNKGMNPGDIVYGFQSIEQYREWFTVDTSQYHKIDYFLFEYDVPEEEFIEGITQCGVPTVFFQNYKHNWSRKLLADTLEEVD